MNEGHFHGGARRGRWTPRRALGIAGLAASAALLAGCGSPSPDTSACSITPTRIIDRITQKLTVEGELRNGRTVAAENGINFISAELLLVGDRSDVRGDILTWATDRRSPQLYLAVDVYAREQSSWPPATFDVRFPGVITSRGCTSTVQGEIPCLPPEGVGGGVAVNVPGAERECRESP